MDPSQYKDYVLVLLFIKYISDKYAGKPFAPITIPDGSSFADMVALKGTDDIGDQINKKIIAPLAQVNNLSDMPDFADPSKLGSGKEMVDRLTNLIALFEDTRLDFSKNRADGDDILGDAYEYLMRHFATESGKSKGQFYTPAEVSRIMARLIGIGGAGTTPKTTVYDPTCGSGSLLLKVADEAKGPTGVKVTLYGQENEATTAGLARMNMILHDNPTADIRQGNTITDPKFGSATRLETFDYVVANPPFSDKRWGTGLSPDKDFGRFTTYGTPPPKQGDYAYLLHILASLKPNGSGACILPHGVLFRGNAEAVIRRNLVNQGFIKAVVGLPSNLFFGTGIPACIVIVDKENAPGRKGIFMIDASKGFIKDGPKNRLREQDVHLIVDTFRRMVDVPGYARMVPLTEIADPKNDFNLNLPRYIDPIDAEDIQDVEAHIKGGIPNRDLDLLGEFWAEMPSLRSQLLGELREGYSEFLVPPDEIRSLVAASPEFIAYRKKVEDLFASWRQENQPKLTAFDKGSSPKELVSELSEALLATFQGCPLLDAYDLYQSLMEFWAETLQDDAYMISIDGWLDAARPREIFQVKDKNNKSVWAEEADYIVDKRRYRSDLLPGQLLTDVHFAAERDALAALRTDLETVEAELEAERDEHAVEDGLLEEVADMDGDKPKIAAATVKRWLKENAGDSNLVAEVDAVQRYQQLLEKQTVLKAQIKTAVTDLDKAIQAAFAGLDEAEVTVLVVEIKWLGHLESSIAGAVAASSRALSNRLTQLSSRYKDTVVEDESLTARLSVTVAGHLLRMGLTS